MTTYKGKIDEEIFVTPASSDPNSTIYMYNKDESIQFSLTRQSTIQENQIEILFDPAKLAILPNSPCVNLLYVDGRVIKMQNLVLLLKVPPKKRQLLGPLPLNYDHAPIDNSIEDSPYYWHYYFRHALQKILKIHPVTITSSPIKPHRIMPTRGFITATTIDTLGNTQKWFIKTYTDLIDFENEAHNNRILSIWQQRNKISVLLTASFHFAGQLNKNGTPVYFLCFEYIEHITLDQIVSCDQFSAEQITLGLVQILEVFARTAPGKGMLTNDMSVIRFWHKDLHPKQIIFELKSKTAYLIDFGNSHLEYVDGRKRIIVGSSSSIPQLEEHINITKMFLNALKKHFEDHALTKMVHNLCQKLVAGQICALEDLRELAQALNYEIYRK